MRPRIVIVGAGFGGIAAARALKRAEADILLIDRTNHHLFQPLLYQVATAALSPADIATATRVLLRGQHNATVIMPRSSSPSPSLLGRRPVAMSTCSAATVSQCPSQVNSTPLCVWAIRFESVQKHSLWVSV